MDIKKQNAKRALTLTTVLTMFVAGFEIFIAYSNYKPGMNFLQRVRKNFLWPGSGGDDGTSAFQRDVCNA